MLRELPEDKLIKGSFGDMVHALTISPIFDLSISSQGIDDDFFSRFTESQHQKNVQPLGKVECGFEFFAGYRSDDAAP